MLLGPIVVMLEQMLKFCPKEPKLLLSFRELKAMLNEFLNNFFKFFPLGILRQIPTKRQEHFTSRCSVEQLEIQVISDQERHSSSS